MFFTATLFLTGRHRLSVSGRVSYLQVGIVWVFHGESIACKSESSRNFTASLFSAGRNRLGFLRRLSSLQVGGRLCVSPRIYALQFGIVSVFHGESLPCRSMGSRYFTASLFFACRNRLHVSLGISSLQVGVV